jgi:hypothetical protein
MSIKHNLLSTSAYFPTHVITPPAEFLLYSNNLAKREGESVIAVGTTLSPDYFYSFPPRLATRPDPFIFDWCLLTYHSLLLTDGRERRSHSSSTTLT